MKKTLGGIAFAVAAFCLTSSVATATTVVCASGATNSFAAGVTLNLTGSGDSCLVGGVTFSNFSISGENTFVPASFSAIATTDGVDMLGFSFNSLLTTNASSSSGVGGQGDIFLTFQSDQPLSAIILGGGSTDSVIETVCSGMFVGENCSGTVLGSNSATGGGTVTVDISGARGITFFGKDISSGSGLTQTVVPEPASLSMMGLGLLGLGLVGRRKRKV